MPAKLQEIEGVFAGERMRFDECLIGTIETAANGEPARPLTIKGDADANEMRCGLSYRFYGRFAKYRNKRTGNEEEQFHFQTFVPVVAHDREGVIAYLAAAGQGLGMGKGTAAKAFDALGGEAVSAIRQNPRELMQFNKRITADQCEAIGEKLHRQKATEDATIDLTTLLAGRGLPKTTARNAIKKWGNRAAEIVRRDPYSLMNFRGCGFNLCDKLYLEMGLDPARLRRQALCAWYAVASQSDGHTWYPAAAVIQAVRQSIGSANARPRAAIRMALRLGRLSPDHYGALAGIKTDGANGPIAGDGETRWLAEGRTASNEESLADMITAAIAEATPKPMTAFDQKVVSWREAIESIKCARCGRLLTAPEVHIWNGKPFGPTCIGYISDGEGVDIVSLDEWMNQQPEVVRSQVITVPSGKVDLPPFSLWPNPASIQGIDDHQREKLDEALISRVAILGGSPGTGKTYATAMLIKALLKSGRVGPNDIAIGAPTGKAAVRLTEALKAAGVDLQARTWHSLLGIGMSDNGDGGWSFEHNEKNPWPFRVIIGDESSMVDLSLMRSIFAARPRGCHVLLVGDVHQLPPVGAGAPLRDIIASQCVGYGELTEIKRNSGGIVEACAAIRDGQRWEPGDNLVIKQTATDQTFGCLMEGIIGAGQCGFDSVWDCQVLVAVNDKSPLSRKRLNQALQRELNDNPEVKGTPFRLADKIVCLKNGRYPYADRDEEGEVYVANGELASVIAIEDKRLLAKLQISGDEIVIPRGKSKADGDGDESSTGCSWDLAYALSCHKSQGSEFPIVFVVLDDYPGARRVCSREWLYTAISRAKERCILLGHRHVADAMCRTQAIGKRKTLLRERLQLELAKGVMEELL